MKTKLSEQHPEYFKQPIPGPDAKGRIVPVAVRWLKKEQDAFFDRLRARLTEEFGETWTLHLPSDEYHLGTLRITVGVTEWAGGQFNFGKHSARPIFLTRPIGNFFYWDQLEEGREEIIRQVKEAASALTQ
jgi:hypothetical protein